MARAPTGTVEFRGNPPRWHARVTVRDEHGGVRRQWVDLQRPDLENTPEARSVAKQLAEHHASLAKNIVSRPYRLMRRGPTWWGHSRVNGSVVKRSLFTKDKHTAEARAARYMREMVPVAPRAKRIKVASMAGAERAIEIAVRESVALMTRMRWSREKMWAWLVDVTDGCMPELDLSPEANPAEPF